MQIIWQGQSCFQIITKKEKNNEVNIIIDPFDESIGLKFPSLRADVLLVSHHHADHANVKAIGGNPFLIDSPGEYEIKEIYIQGIFSFHDDSQGKERGGNTIYTIDAEEIKICHLGDFGQKELTGDQLEKIGNCDILMIPVGGTFTIDSKIAPKIIAQAEPKIVIPMHYQIPKSKSKLKLEGVDKFLKAMGAKSTEPLNKLIIKKKDLSEDGTKIVVLKP